MDAAEAEEWSRWLVEAMPWVRWGRIDWSKVEASREVTTDSVMDDLRELGIPDENPEVIIMWFAVGRPVLETNLKNVLSHMDDVTAVSFDTWIVDKNRRFVLEHFHEDDWDDHTLGLVPGARA